MLLIFTVHEENWGREKAQDGTAQASGNELHWKTFRRIAQKNCLGNKNNEVFYELEGPLDP